MKARKEVMELDPYVPGRSKEEIAQEFGVKKEDIIKLGSNENPFGPAESAKQAVIAELDNMNRYPESNLEELKSVMGKYVGLPAEQIIVGGDVVQRLESIIAEAKRLMQEIRVIEYGDAE